MAGKTLKEFLIKPLIVGGVTAGVIYVVYGETDSLLIAGYQIPAVLVGFTVGAGASIVSDLSIDYVMNNWVPAEYKSMERTLYAPLLSGTALAAGFYFGGLIDARVIPQVVIIGGISELSGQYINDNLIPSMSSY